MYSCIKEMDAATEFQLKMTSTKNGIDSSKTNGYYCSGSSL